MYTTLGAFGLISFCAGFSVSLRRGLQLQMRSGNENPAILARGGKKKRPLSLPDLSQKAFPIAPDEGYDLIVIGSGPGGEACAVRAAQLGKRVAVLEKKAAFGGPTGLTSKAVREATKRIVRAVDEIGGDRRRQVKGLWKRGFPVLKTEAEVLQVAETRDKLKKNGVDLYVGTATFVSGNMNGMTRMRVCRKEEECVEIPARHVVIATGSRPSRPEVLFNGGPPLPFDSSTRCLTATEMGNIKELPNAIAIVGGGVIAVEYATVLAELGVGVSLLCPEEGFMPFLDKELRENLKRRMKASHILFVHEAVKEIIVGQDDAVDSLKVVLEPRVMENRNSTRVLPERRLTVDLLLYSGGRDANSEGLGLENLFIGVGKYGRLITDERRRCLGTTAANSVYAIGDVVGAGLASTAQQQGRTVAELLFGRLDEQKDNDEEEEQSASEQQVDTLMTLFGGSDSAPLTLWTIPEISTVGQTAEGLRAQGKTPFVGFAYYKDIARGRLSGETGGYLKIVALRHAHGVHRIMGVQIMGEGANELIQMGCVMVAGRHTIEEVSRTPFAAVTLSALYSIACDDALLSAKSKSTSS